MDKAAESKGTDTPNNVRGIWSHMLKKPACCGVRNDPTYPNPNHGEERLAR